MIDWLLKTPARGEAGQPAIEVGGRLLPVAVRRIANARRMTLRLAPDGSEVRVTVPRWCRSAEALAFARAKAGWLAAQQAGVTPPPMLGDGTEMALAGEVLTVRHDPAWPRKVVRVGGELKVGGPQEALGSRLARWIEGEARRMFEADLSEYALRAGQPVPRLLLTRAQRRWGSCARDGTIRLNWRLAMAPPHVRRSVVAHEVAHLVHFDHSPAFHALLAELYEADIAVANRWLKREGRSLYRLFG